MKRATPILICLAGLTLLGPACRTTKPEYGRPLPPGAPALLAIDSKDAPPGIGEEWTRRYEILPALERSIRWTETDYSRQFFPMAGITHERALASLLRFREILQQAGSPRAFEESIEREFTIYKSAGWNGRGGGVLFTGYCTPILEGRMQRDAEHTHPLYALPPDLVKTEDGAILGQETAGGLRPYPTRQAIEASALLGGKGLELVWLRDPIDAYIAHVNGSAFIDVGTDELYRLGYAGKNGRDYTSLGKELVADGKLEKDEVSLPTIRRWARENPGEVESYLFRNDSYVFFTPIDGNPRGSLNLEVETRRTIATDKRLFPRGAVVYVDTKLPASEMRSKRDRGRKTDFERFMLDQDTGGAIRTAGRADLYLGIGPEAEAIAGSTIAEGQLYYLFLKESTWNE